MADMYLDNATRDIVIQDGDLYLTSDIDFTETMRQRIRANLLTFLGEWFLDDQNNPTVGVPYFQSLFADKIPTIELAEAIFIKALADIEGVTYVESLSFDYDRTTRVLNVSFKVQILGNGNYVEDVVTFGELLGS